MRLHLKLTPNIKPIPFNYQHQLTGVLHKWLGQNDLHNKISLYSFSWLRGKVNSTNNGLNFPQGARWFISFWESKYSSQLIEGILDKPTVFNGLQVDEVRVTKPPKFRKVERFKVSSPVLIRKNEDNGRRKHLSFKDDESKEYLTKSLQSKLDEANVKVENFSIGFDATYQNAKTKLINIKGTKLKANLCPIIIKGDPRAIEFAWNVGVGELTGSGFGAIC